MGAGGASVIRAGGASVGDGSEPILGIAAGASLPIRASTTLAGRGRVGTAS